MRQPASTYFAERAHGWQATFYCVFCDPGSVEIERIAALDQDGAGAPSDHRRKGAIKLAGFCASRNWRFIPNALAATSVSLITCRTPVRLGSQRTANLERVGIASFRSSKRLPANSGYCVVRPVMLPPGQARLATKPLRTGSVARA